MKKNFVVKVLFLLIFLSVCVPFEEIDFFWHLATGNWIIDNGMLPDIDPFTYTAPFPDSRDLLVLKGYWLSQVVYASFWKVFGAGGIVVLRAFILCGLFCSVYIALKRRGINTWFSLLAVLPIFLDMRLPLFIGIRPQLWSFLFVSILVLILDDFSKVDGWKKCISLGMLILLWSNLHPGVLLGFFLVAIYLFCDLIRNVTEKRNWSCLLLIPVLLLSVLNPVGLKVYSSILEILRPSREMKVYLSSNIDGTNLLELWRAGGFESWGFVLVAAFCTITIFCKIKNIRSEHLIVMILLFSMAIMSARYMIFLTILGIQVSVPYWKDDLLRSGHSLYVKKLVPVLVSALVVVCSFTMYRQQGSVLFESPLREEIYPKGAVQYLKTVRPPGNLFNIYEWGGYLMVFLPEYKVYIDGRGLGANKGSMTEYLLIRSALSPYWKTMFDQREIDVVLSLKDDPNGFDRLNQALLQDPKWGLAYQDDISLVFVRKKI